MGYADFVQVTMKTKTPKTIQTKYAQCSWGNFYAYPEKDQEVPSSQLNNVDIAAGKQWNFAACGREDSPSGTEGSIWFYDGDSPVAKVYWDCPYTGSNNFTATVNDTSSWVIGQTPWSKSGALGTVTVTLVYIGN